MMLMRLMNRVDEGENWRFVAIERNEEEERGSLVPNH